MSRLPAGWPGSLPDVLLGVDRFALQAILLMNLRSPACLIAIETW